jgi:hypothetical protein
MMGFSYSQDNTPVMCFNAAKSWQLGWYSDMTTTLDPLTETKTIQLRAGISDYDHPTSYKI